MNVHETSGIAVPTRKVGGTGLQEQLRSRPLGSAQWSMNRILRSQKAADQWVREEALAPASHDPSSMRDSWWIGSVTVRGRRTDCLATLHDEYVD
jgi:hypothetical protein